MHGLRKGWETAALQETHSLCPVAHPGPPSAASVGAASADGTCLWLHLPAAAPVCSPRVGDWTSVHRSDLPVYLPAEATGESQFAPSSFQPSISCPASSLADPNPEPCKSGVLDPVVQRGDHRDPGQFLTSVQGPNPFFPPCRLPTEARVWVHGRGPLLAWPAVKFLLIYLCLPQFWVSFSVLPRGSGRHSCSHFALIFPILAPPRCQLQCHSCRDT